MNEYCPLLNLPAVFETTLETVPADVPYLSARPEDLTKWRRRLGREKRFKVGLVWAGSETHKGDRRRSMDAALLAPLTELEQATFYSLQVGGADDLAKLPPGRVRDISWHLSDFADTAAAIEQLDLLISVDTAAAHLAGAMGKPVWLMLFFESEWRWMEDRTDSPWYPTMRIFRQSRPHDWPELVGRVREELGRLIAGARKLGAAKANPRLRPLA